MRTKDRWASAGAPRISAPRATPLGLLGFRPNTHTSMRPGALPSTSPANVGRRLSLALSGNHASGRGPQRSWGYVIQTMWAGRGHPPLA